MKSMRALEQYTGTYIGDMEGTSIPMYRNVRGHVHAAPSWMTKYPVGQKFRNGEAVKSLRGGRRRKRRPRGLLRRNRNRRFRYNPCSSDHKRSPRRFNPEFNVTPVAFDHGVTFKRSKPTHREPDIWDKAVEKYESRWGSLGGSRRRLRRRNPYRRNFLMGSSMGWCPHCKRSQMGGWPSGIASGIEGELDPELKCDWASTGKCDVTGLGGHSEDEGLDRYGYPLQRNPGFNSPFSPIYKHNPG